MDKLTLIFFLGLSSFILYLVFYLIKRDKIIDEKFRAIEVSLEDIHHKIFSLEKNIKENSSIKELEKIEQIVETIVDNIKMIEEKNKSFYAQIEEKLSKVKLSSKSSIDTLDSDISEYEKSKVLKLYKNGYSIEEISRTLRMPAGNVELIVKFANVD